MRCARGREMCARTCGSRRETCAGAPQRGWSVWGNAPQSDRAPYLVDHVLKLSLGRVLAERAHDSAQLLRGDGAVTILVEQGEGLLELGNLLLCTDTHHNSAPAPATEQTVALVSFGVRPPLISNPASIGASPRHRHTHGAGAGWAGDALRHGSSPPAPVRARRCSRPPPPAHTSQLVSHSNAGDGDGAAPSEFSVFCPSLS